MSFIQIQLRRGTSTAWASANTVLAEGEIGLELDTKLYKIGDGTSAWSSIGYGGLVGYTGSRGVTGFVGSQGVIGYTGSLGYTGSQGIIGFTGSQGIIGYTGSLGFTGSQGIIGFTGSKGDIGFTGSQGIIGFTGSRGDTGFTGSLGFTGSKGADGNFGGATFDYTFDTSTTASDPGTGKLRFNNLNVSLATAMYIDATNDAATDISAFLNTIDDSTSTIKGHFRVSNRLDASDFALFTISALTNNTGWFTVSCAHVSGSSTSFTNLEDVIITFARTGDIGSTGFTGSRGDTGFTGSLGYTGSQGAGFTGSRGDIGFTGSVGFVGSKGDIGYTGSKGDTGFVGSASTVVGFTGSQGFTGSAGPIGGTNTQVIFNDSGAANGSAGLTFDKTTNQLIHNVASWGTVFRASNSVNFSGIRWDDTGGTIRAGWYRYDNSNLTLSIYDNTGTFQAAPIIISASTGTVTLTRLATTNGTFSGAVSGITTLAAGNTSITGFANVSSTLQVTGITTHGANVSMANNYVTSPSLQAYKEFVSAVSITTTTATLDLSTTNIFNLSMANNVTLTFSNPPTSGIALSFTLYCKQDATGSRVITWPASVKWPNASPPTMSTGANKIDVFSFFTLDGGTTYLGALSLANTG